jgi:short-subunit dehydrogenase
MKNKPFLNKVIIVTGASSGIGKALSVELASLGAKVVIAARNVEKLKITENEILERKGVVMSVVTDISKMEECRNLIDKAVAGFGKIDILINNAGVSMRAKFEEVNLDVIKHLMNVNFYGTVYCTKYALPYILKQHGSVVGISSLAGVSPLPGRTGYSSSKHAMNGFLNTIRVEHLKNGLHVMVAHPGFTASNVRLSALNKDGVPQKHTPRNEEKMMSSQDAAHHIIKALLKRKREITLTAEGKLLAWLYKRVPDFTDKLIYKEMAAEDRESPMS